MSESQKTTNAIVPAPLNADRELLKAITESEGLDRRLSAFLNQRGVNIHSLHEMTDARKLEIAKAIEMAW